MPPMMSAGEVLLGLVQHSQYASVASSSPVGQWCLHWQELHTSAPVMGLAQPEHATHRSVVNFGSEHVGRVGAGVGDGGGGVGGTGVGAGLHLQLQPSAAQ
jgi:hypothetical protein